MHVEMFHALLCEVKIGLLQLRERNDYNEKKMLKSPFNCVTDAEEVCGCLAFLPRWTRCSRSNTGDSRALSLMQK